MEEDTRAAAGLTQAVRELVDAVIRSEVDADELDEVWAEVEALTQRLRKRQLPASYGGSHGWETGRQHWGNAVIGLRNAVAPPVELVREHGRVRAAFNLGAAYEGPPTLVHGGVSALVLDQILGEAAASTGRPSMTGTLSLRYRQPTPLGPLRAEAEVTRVAGVKTYVEGRILAPQQDGSWAVSVAADGIFILPRWARGKLADRERPDEAGEVFFRNDAVDAN